MKKIVFVRHGRAEDSVSEISDLERSLTVKGKIISKQMARRFMEKENSPGLMITSPAFRALETAFIFAGEFGVKPDDIKIDSDLYYKASIKTLIDMLSKIDNGISIITLFGHNPAFTEMPDKLCARGCEFVTKTSVVCISFQTGRWSEIRPDSGKQEYFLKPEKEK
jgi:phosphohistidine phosphatase